MQNEYEEENQEYENKRGEKRDKGREYGYEENEGDALCKNEWNMQASFDGLFLIQTF